MEKYDIVIIGGGVAGAMFAQCISSSYKVLLLTKEDFHKPCGGLLSPRAQKEFGKLNLTLPKEILVDPQIFTVKTIDCSSTLVNHYQRHYINMDRYKFDQWLLSNIPSHVKVVKGNCYRITENKVVYYQSNSINYQVSCDYLIGADGSNSIVRKTIFPNEVIPQYIAIQEWYEKSIQNPFYSCIFDSTISNACSWSISKDNQFIFGGAYPIEDGRKQFEKQKERLEKQGFQFNQSKKIEACLVSRPNTLRDICDGNKTVFLIGEAAGYISPSSFEGISYAISTAVKLAQSFNTETTDISLIYDLKLIPVKFSLLIKMVKTRLLYTPIIRRVIMRSKIKSLKVQEDKKIKFMKYSIPIPKKK